MKNRKKEQGFTLIELLVVVAILAVLAGVAVPRVLGALEQSRTNARLANVAILQGAVDRWALAQTGTPDWGLLTVGDTTPATGDTLDISYLVAQGYLAKAPTTGTFTLTISANGVTVN